jgi:hypothetical protein
VAGRGDHLLFGGVVSIDDDPQVAVVRPGGLVLGPSVFIWADLHVKRWTLTRTTVRDPARGVSALWEADRERPAQATAAVLAARRAELGRRLLM